MNSYKAIFSGGVVTISLYTLLTPALVLAESVRVPPGFENLAFEKQPALVLMSLADSSLGNVSVSYNLTELSIAEPERLAAEIMLQFQGRLNLTEAELQTLLSQPIARLDEDDVTTAITTPVMILDEDDLSARLVLPAHLHRTDAADGPGRINYLNDPGFVHRHSLNYSNSRTSSAMSFNSTDILNFTGNSYFVTDWYAHYAENSQTGGSYSDTRVDQAALYLEHDETRVKLGRQRSTDNYNGSLPSLAANSSFLSLVSFDGASLGYNDSYNLERGQGSATPIEIFMPIAGTVEVYSQGRLIATQNLNSGLQQLNTERWPMGVYEVTLVSNLSNGVTETTNRRFSKQSGRFNAGTLEYLVQGGTYQTYRYQDPLSLEQPEENYDPTRVDDRHEFGHVALAYTTQDGISLGVGALLDSNHLPYAHAGIGVPTDFFLFDQVSADGFIGERNSYGFNTRIAKSLPFAGYNLSYQKARYLVDDYGFSNAGLISGSDGEYISGNVGIPLPKGFSLRGSYSIARMKNNRPTSARNYDIASVYLNRETALTNDISMSWDLGYSENSYNTLGYSDSNSRDRRIEMRVALRQHTNNSYGAQSLSLGTTVRAGEANGYHTGINQSFVNPSFDPGGLYSVAANINYTDHQAVTTSLSGRVDNRFGSTDIGGSFNTGGDGDNFRNIFASHRSGFAISKEGFAFGSLYQDSALLVDASDIPAGGFVQVRGRGGYSTTVPAGAVTTLGVKPYDPARVQIDQVFLGDFENALQLSAKVPPVHVLPGQSYKVKLKAKRNQTMLGRLLLPNGEPLQGAFISGGQAVTNERGFFVADFVSDSGIDLQEITAKTSDKTFHCPINADSKQSIQGVIQLNEVQCESI